MKSRFGGVKLEMMKKAFVLSSLSQIFVEMISKDHFLVYKFIKGILKAGLLPFNCCFFSHFVSNLITDDALV